EVRELIIMATAYEQLFDAKADKHKLATRFGNLFAPFTLHTAAEALTQRRDIYTQREYREAQLNWPLHKKWLHEMYKVRSKAAHTRQVHTLPWGWNLREHLVMGAWVFPLVIKLKLAADGHYVLSQDDRARCRSVDRLLVVTNWGAVFPEGKWAGRTKWY